MTLRSMTLILLSGAALLLASCSSVSCGNAHPYQNVSARPPLKAPPGVTVPPPDPAYRFEGDSVASSQRTDIDAAGRCTDAPPELVPAASTAKPTAPAAPRAATTTAPATASPAAGTRPAPVAAP